MTHPGDNPFTSTSRKSFEEELADLFTTAETEQAEDELNTKSNEILDRIFPVFDRVGRARIIDRDHELEDHLQNERFEQLKIQFEKDLLQTDEGRALQTENLLDSAVEYNSYMAVISERRLQKYICQIAARLIYTYELLSDEEKLKQLDEFEETKRIYLILLRDHFKLEMDRWPAAFDEVTPGVGTAPGINLDDYIEKAAPYVRSAAKKDEREEREIEVLKGLINVQAMSDLDEMVNAVLAVVVIQEKLEDVVDGQSAKASLEDIVNLVESIGEQCGLNNQQTSLIAGYYVEIHAA